jgi:hypothetical protein
MPDPSAPSVPLRAALIEALVKARVDVEAATAVLVNPYSNREQASLVLAEARGRQAGIAQAVEILDAAECAPSGPEASDA